MYSKPQKLVAEFIGTFALIFFGVGSICADQYLRTSSNGTIGLGLLGIALAHGLAIGIMVSALGHISGGHFNPAITFGFAGMLTRKLSTFDLLHVGILDRAQLLRGARCGRLPAAAVAGRSLGTCPTGDSRSGERHLTHERHTF